MSTFWDNARNLLDAAVSAAQTEFATSESMTVLIGNEGGIQLIADNDWPLDRLREDRGARMAYRVSHNKGRVLVDGMEGPMTCHIETEKPRLKALDLIRDQPRYHL